MIDFACKKISIEEIVRCGFSLNKTEYNVLGFLLGKDRERNAVEIAKEMGLERTTVQKALKGLLAKKLVERKQKNIKSGGYVFFYSVIGKEKIKERLLEMVKNWHLAVEEEIKRM